MTVSPHVMAVVSQPMSWLALWWLIALLILGRWRKASVWMLWSGLVVLALLGFRALPDALLRPMENLYPVPTTEVVNRQVGIIVLGDGAELPDSFRTHGQVPLSETAERMTVPVGLIRQAPRLELVFAGLDIGQSTAHVSESEIARAFFQQQGLNMSKVRLDDGARNTREQAQHVAKLLGDRCQEPWLLVTSAWQMPRSMTEFETVSCQVTPYPVDFRTGASTPLTEYSLAHSLLHWQTALREWLEMLIYELSH